MMVLGLLARRAAIGLPIIFGILAFTFMLVRIGNNDPVGLLAGPTATDQDIASIVSRLKLDQPLWRQFAAFVSLAAQGDLGRSWLSDRPVMEELLIRLPATLEMVVFGAILGLAVGVPAGLRAARAPNGLFDQAARVVALVGFGMPTIFLGLVAIFVFFYLLQWAPPPLGRIDLLADPPPVVTHSYLIDALLARDWNAAWSAAGRLVLPVGCTAIVYAAPLLNQTRAVALDVLASDYVRHARASGLPPRMMRAIVWRNSAVPIITYASTELVGLFGVAAVLELIFAWGGVSQFGLTAILKGDFAVVQGFVLMISLIAMIIFACADLLVLWIEPRARLFQR